MLECICSALPSLAVRTKLVVLLHAREAKKPTNTGRIAALAVTGSEVHVRGRPNEPADLSHLIEAGRRVVVLFPQDGAQVLTKSAEPTTLIVPDGSWRQASKMHRREQVLAPLPCVTLPELSAPHLRVRRETKTNGLSTLAAIAHALGILEGEAIKEALLSLDRSVAERVLRSRGRT
jgi:DTW domain-containing protein